MKLTKGRLSKLYSKHKQTKRRFKVNRKRRGPQNTFRKRKPFNLDRKTLKKIRGGQQGNDPTTNTSTGTTQEKTGNKGEIASVTRINPTGSDTNTNVSMDTAQKTSDNKSVAPSRVDKLATDGVKLANENELRNIISAIKGDGTDNSILDLITNNKNGPIDLDPEVDGTTVLIAAARAGRQTVVDAIISKDGFEGINKQNTDGETALMVAVKGGHTNIVNNLLKAKPAPADVNITNNNGKTALQIAEGLPDSEEKTNIIEAINKASSSTSSDIPTVEATAVNKSDGTASPGIPIAEATSVDDKSKDNTPDTQDKTTTSTSVASAPPATSDTTNTTNTTDTATGPAAATTETTATGSAAAVENYRQAALALQVAQDALYAAMTKSGNDMNPSALEATTIAADKFASASDK